MDWLAVVNSALLLALAIVAALTRKAQGETKAAVQEIHLSLNSRLDKLLEVTAESSRAKGVIEGTDAAAATAATKALGAAEADRKPVAGTVPAAVGDLVSVVVEGPRVEK